MHYGGRLTDNKGRVVNFKNTLIIMPSNIGSYYLSRALGGIIQENFEHLKDKNLEEVIEKTQSEVMDPASREPCAPSSRKPSRCGLGSEQAGSRDQARRKDRA